MLLPSILARMSKKQKPSKYLQPIRAKPFQENTKSWMSLEEAGWELFIRQNIRDNSGGEWGAAHLIISYFFSKPTVYNTMYDRTGIAYPGIPTLEQVPGKRFEPDLPVYILTSRSTGSAAESFVYTMKHCRGAIVVGETAIGMAHPSKEVEVTPFFRVSVPFRRSENIVTKTDWEGIGVIPHIKVTASKALEKALEDVEGKKLSGKR